MISGRQYYTLAGVIIFDIKYPVIYKLHGSIETACNCYLEIIHKIRKMHILDDQITVIYNMSNRGGPTCSLTDRYLFLAAIHALVVRYDILFLIALCNTNII